MTKLEDSYRLCRELHRHHGRTYYLATRLLPRERRRHVHALYGFARFADEIVDSSSADDRLTRLREWSQLFLLGLKGEPVDDPLLPAVLDTIERFELDLADFEAFLASMEMDLVKSEYADYTELLSYMDGSAAAIGTMMLPLLDPVDPAAAREPARQLGIAFQLTNFIRDVAEDLDRGRVYLPQADLDRFGVTREMLERRVATGEVRGLIGYEMERARQHYAAAEPGLALLAPAARRCIGAAYRLYAAILDEVDKAGRDVFVQRAVVSDLRKLGILLGLAGGRQRH